MRNILILLLVPILVSCQALNATTSVIAGSSACNSSEKEQSFPPEGAIKKIDLSLTISYETSEVSFSETAVCEYQGSMCGGGAWFQVWYGDQSISHNITLPQGDELIFKPHSFCITIDEYVKQCKSGNCDHADSFKLLMMFSEARRSSTVVVGLDWTKGKSQDRALVKANDFKNYGYQVKHFSIEVADESL
ncbi:hypothetical protein [Marinobacterium jannaschii]|uniref:hypothetical protein n=1 Tax=Marinobacterium jannaschii TaxID=64970 RepID=UPI000480FC78|nr:hypothetical protein [Marinobacterium jannaschii]